MGVRLAVDLLNTMILQADGLKDLVREPGSAAAWAEATGVVSHGARLADGRDVRRFREMLRRGSFTGPRRAS